MPSISLNTNNVLQAALLMLHVLNLAMPNVPDKYKGLAAGVLGLLNWLVSYIGHNSTLAGNKLPPEA